MPSTIDTAVRDLALGADGDVYVTNGDLGVIAGTEGILSDIRARAQTQLGECFLDTALGVPWRERILGQKPTLATLKSIFRDLLLGTPGVASVLSLDATLSARTLRLSFKALALSGDALADVLIIPIGGT